MKKIMGIATVLLAGACGKGDGPHPAESPSSAEPAAQSATAPAHSTEPGELTWIHDDYQSAIAAGRAANIPVVIDMWAPWCHTCLSMQEYVLKDPGLRPLANRFVWLALDTDKPEAAPALEKFPVTAWPTFFIVQPTDETVLGRFVGAATVEQFREFLQQGENTLLAGAAGPQDETLRFLRAGDQAAVASEWAAADKAYGQALAAAGSGWIRRPDVLVSQISARYSAKEWERCLQLAETAWDQTGNSSSAADFIYYAGACADQLPEQDPRRRSTYERAIARLEPLIKDEAAPLSWDDRSDALRIFREFCEKVGEPDRARLLAAEQRALLDKAAAEAPNAFVAMTYNWPRAEVYVYLGIGAELIPALEKSEQDLPSQYDPPYRLAWVHMELGNYDKALAAADRAVQKMYGPRKANAYRLIAAIHSKRGDEAAQIEASRQVVAVYESLPPGQQKPAALQAARAKLAELLGGE